MRFVVDYGKDDKDVGDTLIVLTSQGGRRPKGRLLVRFSGLFVMAVGVALEIAAVIANVMMLAVAGMAIVIVGIIVTLRVSKAYVEREHQIALEGVDADLYVGRRTYEVDEQGIRISTGRGPRPFSWAALSAWGRYSHYMYARGDDGVIVLVDVANLEDEQVDELQGLLAEHLGEELPPGAYV